MAAKKSTKKAAIKKSGAKSSPSVKIYTTPTCHWCMMTKEFFKKNKVKYKEVDVVMNDVARQEMIEKSGQMGVPVIEIGNQIIIGFDEDALRKALKIK
jgi:glutaredoxin-like YruB-family protein